MYSFATEEILLCHQQKKNALIHISKEVPVFSKIITALLGVCCTVTMGLPAMAHAESTHSASALSGKQQSIILIAAFTAKGDTEKLKGVLVEGLQNGMTVNEIKEVLVQMYAYTGFPRSLTGLNTFIAIVGISTGPTFIQGFQEVGWSLFLIGAAATSIPLVAGIFIGRYLFRFNDALTLGCVAGARTTTAALGAVEETIQRTSL